MFKNIKLKARNVVSKKYKYFFPFVLLYEFAGIINLCLWNFGVERIFSNEANFLLTSLFIFLCIFIQFLVLPVLVVAILKTGVCLTQGSSFEIKLLLSCDNVLKIVLINLVPNIFFILNSLLKYFKIYFEKNIFYLLIFFALQIIRYIIKYKFFACNYCFIVKESSVKETLITSFNAVKGMFFKYIIYDFSFILWDLLIIILFFLMSMLNMLTPNFKCLQFLIPSGFGIMFYYRPYRLIVDLFFSKNLLSNKNNN